MKNIKKPFNKDKSIFKKIIQFFFSLSNVKIIFLTYFIVTLLSSLLLISPYAHVEGVYVSYIDALFTAASAFSDTGLVTLVTSETWSMFGQAIIAILILLGGIGIFAIKVYLFNFIFGQKLNIVTSNIVGQERSSKDASLSKKTIIVSVTLIIILIIFASFILSFIFYFQAPDVGSSIKPDNNPYGNVSLSIRFAIFHSISAINNAGFDIIGGDSLAPYYSVYIIQFIFLSLFIVGGMGYPVIFDLYSCIQHKIKKTPGKFSFSLFTKISTLSYLIISIVGLIFAFSFELSAKTSVDGNLVPLWLDDSKDTGSKVMAIFFNTFSTRNAGFSTVNLKQISQPTIILYSIMMFIGSAPSSTAGGIRTTTIALICLSIWSKIRGLPSVRVFNRKLPKDTTETAGIVFSISIFFVLIVSFIGMSSIHGDLSPKFNYLDVLFEVSSAFGTTGLSTGLTSHLNDISKLFIVLTMFIGQLGISSTLLMWKGNKNKQYTIDYIEEDIAIG
ncbi:MAG: TrkH family potassium uptake protein [Mycoplasmataceae bacterium]|nr:TrkH family potassium uptake protein [Mycoplasmataceae bacterium]